ncbi:helix-turn-helix domain-containing protein [Alteromonas facilis]|uniref:helix-turn-helix domain-containing protein n=1 Tax=Alteromonas facilis TaxID=2048004 RepID=UPI000C288387|nr:helix-turn-helix transcriptional regulator [Alteromonas facilis]
MPDLTGMFSTGLLGKAIAAKRTGMKLRLIDVATTLSISKQTLVKIEKGDDKVNFAILLKVMEYLGLSFQIISDDLTDSQEKVSDEAIQDDWF